jgi:hypothetical protein
MLKFILAFGAGAAVTVMEQSLTHVSNGHRVILGAIVVVPVAALYWWLSRRPSSAPSGTAAPRPSYSFSQLGRRS